MLACIEDAREPFLPAAAASTMMTSIPAFTSPIAEVRPTGPAPTTSTCVCISAVGVRRLQYQLCLYTCPLSIPAVQCPIRQGWFTQQLACRSVKLTTAPRFHHQLRRAKQSYYCQFQSVCSSVIPTIYLASPFAQFLFRTSPKPSELCGRNDEHIFFAL